MDNFRDTDARVVISVSGGVAEEVTSLARGPVQVYIVDWDEIEAINNQFFITNKKKDLAKYLATFPADIRAWIRENK